MTSSLISAQKQFEQVRDALSPALVARIEKRLASWRHQTTAVPRKSTASLEVLLLTRPAAPPRPVSSALFVLRSI